MTGEATRIVGRRSRSYRPVGASVDAIGQGAVAVTLLAWGAGVAIGFQNALAILTTLAFAAAVWGIRQPVLGLLGVSLLCTLDAVTRHLLMTGGLLRWNTLNYWLIGVALLHGGFVWRANDRQSVLTKALIIVLALYLIGSPDVPLGIQQLLGILPVFGLLVYFVRGAQDDRVWLWLALVNGTAGALGGLLFNVQRDALPALNHNVWGFFPLTAIFAIALSFPAIPPRPVWAIITGFLAAVNLCWILLSGSRGDLLIGTLCLMFITAMMRSARWRVGYAAATVSIALLVLGTFPDMRERTLFRVQKLLDNEETLASRTSGRSDLVTGGIHIAVEHPLGVGTGGYAAAWAGLGYIEEISGFKFGEEMAAHAGWIKVLVENGVLGFILLMVYVGSFAASGWQRGSFASIRVGLLVSTVLATAFMSTEFQPRGLWFLAAGASAVINREQLQLALLPYRAAPRLRMVRESPATELT